MSSSEDEQVPLISARQKVSAKALKSTKELLEKKEAIKEEKSKYKRGIVYLSNIPHGFYEKEITKFFSQFGNVLGVAVGRSKKTGKSKGYAHVEFEFLQVAKIAADTMNNYLMFNRLVKCKLLPDANRRKIFTKRPVTAEKFPKRQTRKYAREQEMKEKTKEEKKDILGKRMEKVEKHNERLEQLGISYKFTI